MIAESEIVDKTLSALADANRRAIVSRLTRGPATVSELAEPLAITLPATMQHLGVLEQSGLVRSEKQGRVRTCHLEPAPLKAVERWVSEQRKFWEGRLDLLGDVLDATYGGEKK